MTECGQLRDRILAASKTRKAQLVLKAAKVLNVFTEELERVDVAISDGYIVGLGEYEGERELFLDGMVICPGFLDGHIHLESSMVSPEEFERAVLPHGTTGVVTDPHEIANVAGTDGIDYMLDAAEELLLDVYVMLPSCVPATALDESGAVLDAARLRPYYQHRRVLGLAEVMNAYGTVSADRQVLEKIMDAKSHGKIIDGHAPGISGAVLNGYVTAGVRSDHECSSEEEAIEKLRRGQWIMIREGTAARNLQALMSLCREPYYHRCMFVTDDKHPGDLLRTGHMDAIIRKAVAAGADPVKAVKMGSFHTAQYFGLTDTGAVAPGYKADLVVLSDLPAVTVHQVYKGGRLAAEDGKYLADQEQEVRERRAQAQKASTEKYTHIYQSFHLKGVKAEDFDLKPRGDRMRVIRLVPGELLTKEQILPWTELPGYAPGVNPSEDVVKMAVLERHLGTGHIGIGFLGGYGLREGAVATSVAHDSHNLITAGVCDEDMALAANTVRKNQGGLAVVKNGMVLGELALPIGGLMSPEPAAVVDGQLTWLKELAAQLSIAEGIDPFMTLAFASLPVIPSLRLNTYGLIDTEKQKIIPVTF